MRIAHLSRQRESVGDPHLLAHRFSRRDSPTSTTSVVVRRWRHPPRTRVNVARADAIAQRQRESSWGHPAASISVVSAAAAISTIVQNQTTIERMVPVTDTRRSVRLEDSRCEETMS